MKQYLLLALVVLAGIVPFSSRAVFMDEHIYIQIARSAQTNWLFPQDTPKLFFGHRWENFADHTHPPVVEYYLAFLYSILGEFREVPFRLLLSIFPLVAVFAFYQLAKRFTAQPLLVTLLFAVSPAFVIYSPTLMMDVPLLAFLLLGFALYFSYVQGRRRLLPLVSVCFILAAGTGYTALIPISCFGIGLIAARRPLRELLAVAAAPIAIAIWVAILTVHFGSFPMSRMVEYYASQGSIFRNLLATLSFLGAVVICPWAVEGGRRWLVLGSIALASALTIFVGWPSMGYRIWFIMLAASGLAMLARFAAAAGRLIASGRNSGEAFLMLWPPAALGFFIIVADMINARYILLSVPPLLLMLFREAGQRRIAFTVVATATLSAGLAYADFTFVNSYRDWVDRTVPPLQQQGFGVWSGAESGLRFYLEEKGTVSLATADAGPREGDLIVRHALYRYALSPSLEPVLTILKTFTLVSNFPVRTYNARAAAGLHDSNTGLVPFIVSRAPFDTIEVAQVNPLPGAVWSPSGPILQQAEAEREFPMKIPANTKIEYDLDGGDGAVAVTSRGLRLIKGPSPVIVWRNFRIVPKQFAVQ
jgi:4-amino-4-deoxy-L-arabinose transferase-like glycosyltransferase